MHNTRQKLNKAVDQGGRFTMRGGHDVLILAGSLRRESVSRVAGEILFKNLTASGIPTRLMLVEELALPFFNPDLHYDDNAFAQDYLDAVRQARALIWCAPSYHRTISGSFKNAIDFLELLLNDKPMYLSGKCVGAVATSKGIVSAANAASELAMAAQALRAFAFPLQIPITASHKVLGPGGELKDKRIEGKLDLLAQEVRAFLKNGLSVEAEAVGAH
jgi:NAD(P)H-dependent FMN reductase